MAISPKYSPLFFKDTNLRLEKYTWIKSSNVLTDSIKVNLDKKGKKLFYYSETSSSFYPVGSKIATSP